MEYFPKSPLAKLPVKFICFLLNKRWGLLEESVLKLAHVESRRIKCTQSNDGWVIERALPAKI